MRIVYRSGDLRKKADTITEMSGRSTGYFGTGYYFCTKPEFCAYQGRGERPIFRIKLKDDLKWLRGSLSLHEELKTLHRYLFNYPSLQLDLDSIIDFASEVQSWISPKEKLGTGLRRFYEEWGEDFPTWKSFYASEYSLRNLALKASHATSPSLNEFGDKLREENLDEEWFNNFPEDYFNEEFWRGLKRLKRNAEMFLPISLNIDEDLFKKTAEEVYNVYRESYNESNLDLTDPTLTGADSLVTVFLKILGYDGVWPNSEVDNTTYGGVFFEQSSIEDITTFSSDGKKFL